MVSGSSPPDGAARWREVKPDGVRTRSVECVSSGVDRSQQVTEGQEVVHRSGRSLLKNPHYTHREASAPASSARERGLKLFDQFVFWLTWIAFIA